MGRDREGNTKGRVDFDWGPSLNALHRWIGAPNEPRREPASTWAYNQLAPTYRTAPISTHLPNRHTNFKRGHHLKEVTALAGTEG